MRDEHFNGLLDEARMSLLNTGAIDSEILEKLTSEWSSARPDDQYLLDTFLDVVKQAEESLEDSSSSSFGPMIGWHDARRTANTEYEPTECDYRCVYFATNRSIVGESKFLSSYSIKRDVDSHYGICKVELPRSRQFGSLGKLSNERVRIEEIVPQDFHELVERCRKDRKSHGIILIHGFNVTFEDAAKRCAQLAFDLKIDGPAVFYSWPSFGRSDPRSYAADIAASEASEVLLSTFLAQLCESLPDCVFHVIAHSMGNRLLIRSIQRTIVNGRNLGFGQVLLAAPDVDTDYFRGVAGMLSKHSIRATLYSCGADKPLYFSTILHAAPRAGYSPPVTVIYPEVDTVVVPNFNLDLLGHSYYGDADAVIVDMHQLIQHNSDPRNRIRLAVRGNAESPYYEMIR